MPDLTSLTPANLSDTLSRALPERFPFYHLGEVENSGALKPLDASEIALDENAALGIRLQGDIRALLLLLVDSELDLSLYSEVANILASQLANRLSDDHDLDVVISAPSEVSAARLRTILKKGRSVALREYVHRHRKAAIPVRAVLILEGSSGGANA